MKPVSIKGFRGINNLLSPESIQALPTRDSSLVELVDAVNVDIDDAGGIQRRAGQHVLIPGAAHSLYSNGNDCLFVQDGMMYALNRELVPRAVAAGLGREPMAYVTVGERVYHTNGRFSAVYENGYVRSWGIDLGLTSVSASVTSGHLTAGTYLFAMTLLREDGQESGCAATQRITVPDGGGIVFSWAVPDEPGIVRAALYLSQADGETLFLADTANAADGSYTYTGGPRSLPLATQWLDKPPAGTSLAMYRGRIYIASGAHLFATTPLSYEHCDLRDYRSIDGSDIRLLAAVDSGLFIGTERAVYFLSGASFADNALVRKFDGNVVAGSLAAGDAGEILGNPQMNGMAGVMFATSAGVVLGMPDGSLINLTSDRYQMPAASTGAAVLHVAPNHQYLLTLDA